MVPMRLAERRPRSTGMYRAIREYGQRLWAEAASADCRDALAQRHTDHYLGFAEEWNARIPGPRDQEALDRIANEIGNLTKAEDWAMERGEAETGARVALAVAETMKVRRPPSQLIPLLERALQVLAEPSALTVRLETHLSAACQIAGDWNRALDAADDAVSNARARNASNLPPQSLWSARLKRCKYLAAWKRYCRCTEAAHLPGYHAT